MEWNNGLEQKMFWKRLNEEVECFRKNGCPESEIRSWVELNLRAFRSDRRYAMHTQPLEISFEEEAYNEECTPLYQKFRYELTSEIEYIDSGQFGWIESIENEAIYNWANGLDYKDKVLLSFMVEAQMNLKEAAMASGISYATAKRHLSKWKVNLRNIRKCG